jgi:3-hydroxyacyl-CoA dehydrogenase/enoyl-CoA hydratase/3-hydroxybutyryl-CoA epimerase
MSSTIRWEQDTDGIVVLTLDDPSSSVNTRNDAYVQSVGETVDRLEREKESVCGVVLTSAKKTFFAGGNLGSLIKAGPDDRQQALAHVTLVKSQLRRLETLGLPPAILLERAVPAGSLRAAVAS